jgi:4-amino-4-deoxy-L-arabinose transferase-like glycosyltransferase
VLKKVFKSHYFWLTAISFLSQLYFFNRGFTPHDEGNMLHAAQRMLDVLAALFKLFGESILTGRVLMLIINTLTFIVIYKITHIATKKPHLGYFAALLFLSWGPTHINFPWHSMFALLSGVLTMLCLLMAIKFNSQKHYFLSGLTTFLTFLFKQNFGVALLIVNIIFFLTNKNKPGKKAVLSHLLGFTVPALIFEIYLINTSSLVAFINNFYQITISEIVVKGSLTTPFIYEYSFMGLVKTIFYLLPAILSIFSIIVLFAKRKQNYIFLGFFVFLFYIFGIRPITDYNHLSAPMSLVGIPLILSIAFAGKKNIQKVLCLAMVGLTALGFYTSLFKGYYRWETPLIKQNIFLDHPRAKIFADKKYSSVISTLSPYIKKYSDKDGYIFAYKHAPMFYFLYDRNNPTQYLSIARGSFADVQKAEIIVQLEKKDVKLVILQAYETGTKDKIINYVLENYTLLVQAPDYTLLKRN